jgi:hypothetical protein
MSFKINIIFLLFIKNIIEIRSHGYLLDPPSRTVKIISLTNLPKF